MRKLRIAAIVAVAGVVLSACAQNGTDTGNPSSAPTTGGPVTSSTAQPEPTSKPTGMPPANESAQPTPGQPGGPVVLTGTITEGVEQNCLLLDGYLLVGGPRDVIRAGARVVVTGQPEPDLMTTCQQGTPFRVLRAQPA